ncbi:MAG: tetratricopeptide repeat protein [Planctomycetota bacterium]
MIEHPTTLRAAGICLLFCILGLLCRDLSADVVYLKDGSKKEGKILERSDKEIILEIQVKGLKASVRIPMDKVASIEQKRSPVEEYAEMAASLSPDDAEGFYKLGMWCEEKKITDKAEECFRKAIEISPTFEDAGIKLGLVRVDRKWHTVDEIRSMAGAQFRAKKYEAAAKLLEHLRPLPATRMDSITKRRVLMDLAPCYEGMGNWQQAIDIYDEVVKCASQKADIALARVRQGILAGNPDGTFDCPADLSLFKSVKDQRAANLLGKQSLTRPEVMDFAVRAEANKIIQEIKEGMAKAAEQSRFNPEEANVFYAQLTALACQADYLVPDISKPVRLQIALTRDKLLDIVAAKYMKEIQADPGYNKAQEYPGKLEQAQAYIRKIDELTALYQEKIDMLRPFSEQASKPVDAALKELEKAEDLKRKATEAVGQLMDYEEIERLEETIAANYAKAKAIDPCSRDFKYGYDAFKSADGLYHFVDDGKEWRKRSESCIRYCEKALDASKKKLELCRKYPTQYRAQISQCKADMIRIYELMMRTIANRDCKGDDSRH